VDDLASIPRGFDANRLAWTAGAGAGLLALTRYDRSLTTRVSGTTDDYGIRFFEEFGNVRTVRPATMLILTGALMAGDRRLQDAAFTSLESIVLANLVTDLLKTVVGRARPWQDEGPSSFKPFSGKTSFPSGHATTAFAALTPYALYYGNATAAVLYAVATGTAASRMATNVHWLSDVVGGAAIGFLTAQVLTRRHRGMARIRIVPVLTSEGAAGVELRF
jgi:membrane-associated phospholipid phosphatase